MTFLGERSRPSPVPVYRTSIGHIATIICYDLDFLDTARQAGRRGAQLVAVPSNDWPDIAPLHYTHLVFRAIENRLTFVKADTAWDSAIVDPYGRIVRKTVTPAGAPRLLVADVPLGRGRAPAQTIESWVPVTCLLAGVVILVAPRLRRRRNDTV